VFRAAAAAAPSAAAALLSTRESGYAAIQRGEQDAPRRRLVMRDATLNKRQVEHERLLLEFQECPFNDVGAACPSFNYAMGGGRGGGRPIEEGNNRRRSQLLIVGEQPGETPPKTTTVMGC
jgi:hypothetical protein